MCSDNFASQLSFQNNRCSAEKVHRVPDLLFKHNLVFCRRRRKMDKVVNFGDFGSFTTAGCLYEFKDSNESTIPLISLTSKFVYISV